MKIYAATTLDPLPLTEVLERTAPQVFPAGIEVSAIHAGNGRWHLNTKADGSVFDGQADAGQLQFTHVLARINEGV